MATKSEPDDGEVLVLIISAMKKLDEDAQRRVYETIGTFFQLGERTRSIARPKDVYSFFSQEAISAPEPSFSADRAPHPKHFINEKQPRTDVERVACLAFYLTHYRDMPQFTTVDISKLNTEAAQRKLANPTAAVNNATQYGYLVPGTKGAKQISAAGERYVQALPDYETAKAAMAAARPRWRSKARTSKKESQ